MLRKILLILALGFFVIPLAIDFSQGSFDEKSLQPALFIFLMLGLLVWDLLKDRATSKQLNKIAEQLGGTVKQSFWKGPSLVCSFKDRVFSIKFELAYRHRHITKYLSFACPLKRKFEVKVSKLLFGGTWLSFLTRPIGTKAIPIGDPEFNKKYSVAGKDINQVASFLGNVNIRMELEELLKDFYSFSIKKRVATAKTLNSANFNRLLIPEKSKEIFSRLAKLLDFIEEKSLAKKEYECIL